MKIKELHLRNIASIEKADIDFEKDIVDKVTGEPANIFLISGDTGTGKSVILDGISMALYKKTPRIVSVANKTNNEYTDKEGESININSIEQYTRLGISEREDCYSELVFEGNDGKEYRARLELGIMKGVADEHGKRPLKHRAPKWIVKVGKEDWQKVEACTGQPILGAVGLTFEQFGRMAMLAQGQFASFLTGDKKEREQILEQLTNTEKFSVYGEAIASLFNSSKENKRIALQTLETEKSHTLASEKLDALKLSKMAMTNLKRKKEEEHKELFDTLQIINNLYKNKETKLEIERAKTSLEAEMNGEAYKQSWALVRDWTESENARAEIQKLQEAEKQKKDAEDKRAKAQFHFQQLSADLAYRKAIFKATEEKLQILGEWIGERKVNDELFANFKEVCVRLDGYQSIKKKLLDEKNTLKNENSKTNTLINNVEIAKKNSDDATQIVANKQNEIDTLSQKRADIHPEKMNTAIEAMNKRRSTLEKFETDIKLLQEEKEKAQKQESAMREDEKRMFELKQFMDAAEKDYHKAKDVADKAKELLTTMQMSLDDKLKELRHRLRDEHAEVCPLCGQKLDKLHLEDDFGAVLTPLQETERKAKNMLDEVTKKFKNAEKEYNLFVGTFEANRKNLEAMNISNTQKEQILMKSAITLSVNSSKSVKEEIKKVEEQLDKLLSLQQQAEKLQADITQLVEEKKPLDTMQREAVKAKIEADNALKINTDNVIRLSNNIAVLKKELQDSTAVLSQTLDASYPDWQKLTTQTISLLKTDATAYNEKKDTCKVLKENSDKLKALLNPIEAIYGEMICRYNYEQYIAEAEYFCKDIHNEWTQLFADVKQLQSKVEECNQIIISATKKLNAYYTACGKSRERLLTIISQASEVEKARDFVKDKDECLKSCTDALAAIEKVIKEDLDKLKVGDIGNIPNRDELKKEADKLGEGIQKLSSDIGGIEAQLNANDINIDKVRKAQENYDKVSVLFEKWHRINSIFGGNRFRTLVQTYILRPLLNNANIYLEKITDRYTLTCSEDNEQLSILVLDRYNKNQVRSVTVLSGGERFMISLALSLALSSLNRQDMNVNILFIDEGFGTLDETNLHSVMSTLEKLQEIAGQSNRRVGIISHREELVERIPIKIFVKKRGEGRSCVEINS